MATRLSTPGRDGVDAVIAAKAALERLGEESLIAEELDTQWYVPQVGQGALALETRSDDETTNSILRGFQNDSAAKALECERAFLRELGAGCSIPAGAYATVGSDTISITGLMIAADGSTALRETLVGVDPEALGRELAKILRDERGGSELLGWASE